MPVPRSFGASLETPPATAAGSGSAGATSPTPGGASRSTAGPSRLLIRHNSESGSATTERTATLSESVFAACFPALASLNLLVLRMWMLQWGATQLVALLILWHWEWTWQDTGRPNR